MDTLILVHIGYIVALVWFVFRSGERSGRRQMIHDFLDRGIVTQEELLRKYDLEPK